MLTEGRQALNVLIDTARLSLFRLQTLDLYDTDCGEFQAYVDGEDGPDPGRKARWHRVLQADLDRLGACTRRVHVVRSPLTDYLRFEAEWGYAYNQAFEDIRIIDTAEQAWFPEPAGRDDFWLIDRKRAAVLRYDADGYYLGFEEAPAAAVPSYVAASEVTWACGVPFADWWDSHGEYHRDSLQAA